MFSASSASSASSSPPALPPDHVAATQYLWYGHRNLRDTTELELCWKAAKAIAAGDAPLTEEEHDALLGKMTATAVPPSVIATVLRWDPQTATPAGLLAHLELPTAARLELGLWIVYEGISIAFADGSLGLGEIDGVYDVAETMGVPFTTVDALIALCREEALLRSRRIKTLEGRIALASPRPASSSDHELIPITVRAETMPPLP
jgi:hypothetical protein